MINVNGLVRDFGQFRAVDNVQFDVPKGQVLGFLGPNGAGKSTTMKMLTGYLEPTSGTATVDGFDILKQPLEVKKRIGYLPESAPSYSEMSVSEFLAFVGNIRGLYGNELKQACSKMRSICELKAVWHKPIEALSKGFRQRVGFAQALIHDPPVLVLDEPTDGLDPNQKHHVRELIKEMGQDKTIILSTHILEEVEAICERVVIISEGKVVADESPYKLKEQSRYHNAVTISLPEGYSEKAQPILESIDGVDGVELIGASAQAYKDSLRVFPKDRMPILDRVTHTLSSSKIEVKEVYVEQGRLDEVFRNVTKSTD